MEKGRRSLKIRLLQLNHNYILKSHQLRWDFLFPCYMHNIDEFTRITRKDWCTAITRNYSEICENNSWEHCRLPLVGIAECSSIRLEDLSFKSHKWTRTEDIGKYRISDLNSDSRYTHIMGEVIDHCISHVSGMNCMSISYGEYCSVCDRISVENRESTPRSSSAEDIWESLITHSMSARDEVIIIDHHSHAEYLSWTLFRGYAHNTLWYISLSALWTRKHEKCSKHDDDNTIHIHAIFIILKWK